MHASKNCADCFNLKRIGWKHRNTIIKKAMDQEFKARGLFINLSIAFFIVIASAVFLNFMFNSWESAKQNIAGQNAGNAEKQISSLYIK